MEDWLQQTFLDNPVKNYLWFAGILLGGILFKKFVAKKLSEFIYFLFKKQGREVGIKKFIELFSSPLQLFFMLLIIYLAFNKLKFPEAWRLVPDDQVGVRLVIIRVFIAVFIISIIRIALRMIDFIGLVLIRKATLTVTRKDDQMIHFLAEVIKVVVAVIGFIILLSVAFRMDVISLIAGLGIGGLALALAAKESLENLLSSFTILLDKPFAVGDQVKTGAIEGKVESIGFRSTRIRTLDQMLVMVPNKKMVDVEVFNEADRSRRRAKFVIGLSYDTTPEKMKAVVHDIRKLLKNNDKIEMDPSVHFLQFGTNSLDLQVIYLSPVSDPEEFFKIQEEINFRIMEIVEQHDCRFAFTTTAVTVKQ